MSKIGIVLLFWSFFLTRHALPLVIAQSSCLFADLRNAANKFPWFDWFARFDYWFENDILLIFSVLF